MTEKIKKEHKYAFLSAVIVGFLCYLYAMTHHLLTYDSMWNIVSKQDMISSGRQFLTYACRISSDYDLPALNGMLAIFYLGVTATLLVDIFNVRKTITAALIGGILVTFPSVSSTFCYTFTVDGYMLSVLAITVAFWLADRFRYGFIASIFLTAFSIGIYQAFYSYLIMLCILVLLIRILENESIKSLFKYVWRYLVMGIAGYVVYVITLKIMLNLSDSSVSGYQGTDKVLSFPFANIFSGLKAAIYDFKMFARWGHVFTTTSAMKLAYALLILLGTIIYIYCFIKNGRYKQPCHILMTAVLLAATPFSLELIAIMAPDAYVHILTRFAWVLFFVFVFVLSERMELESITKTVKSCIVGTVIICGSLMIFEFTVINNIISFQMEERYEKTYGLCLRIVDRLEQMEDYETGMEVAILGGGLSDDYYPKTNVTEELLSGYFGVSGEYCVNSSASIAEFARHYLNYSLTTISEEREAELVNTEEFKTMEKFPHSGCIKKINGVFVIKLNG